MRRNQHYQDRVNRVLDYIAGHLDGDLSLAHLSAVACIFTFHFHRIFQGVILPIQSAEASSAVMRRIPSQSFETIVKNPKH